MIFKEYPVSDNLLIYQLPCQILNFVNYFLLAFNEIDF